MNNNLEFENEDPSPDSIEDNHPRTNYGEGYNVKETLEEAVEKYAGKYALSTRHISHIGFEDGAKWQQERMYSEEDMAESFMACWKANVPEGFECKLSFYETV